MEFIPWLFEPYSPMLFPRTFSGWLGWLFFLGLLIWMVWLNRPLHFTWSKRAAGIFVILILLALGLNLFYGVRLLFHDISSLPGIPQEMQSPAIMPLSVLPLMIAGGVLGPWAGVLLGLFAGSLRFISNTHNIFSPLEMVYFGLLFSLAIRQRYQTKIFALLRQPFVTALILAILYFPVSFVNDFLLASGSLATRVDYGLSGLISKSLPLIIEIVVGGIILQGVVWVYPALFHRNLPLEPSPMERSIEVRFFFGTVTIVVALLFMFLWGDWIVAGSVARNMLGERMKDAADLASKNVAVFLEIGQNLALQIAEAPGILSANEDELNRILEEEINSIPFFDQLLIYDQSNKLLGGYSAVAGLSNLLLSEEITSLKLAFNGMLVQVCAIPPVQGENAPAARVSFIIGIMDPATEQVGRVLIARTDLASNLYAQPLINSLQSIPQSNGVGALLDENNRFLNYTASNPVMSMYTGHVEPGSSVFDDVAPDGTRSLVYYQPVTGYSWSVVMTVPARQAQQFTINFAAPLSVMIVVISVIALILLKFSLKGITQSLQNFAVESVRIAQGQLDKVLPVEGYDEIGQLRRAFEQMRVSLQARMAELNRLLLVSQGVASSLDVREAIQPVMEAVLATGASAVRIILYPLDEEFGDVEGTPVLALGPKKASYAQFDDQVSIFAEHQQQLFVEDALQFLGLQASSAGTPPVSLFAILLKNENKQFGVLWAGYAKPYQFVDSNIRFLTTLARQATLAASNHYLFRSSEIGRQRLSAILASSPDPVLVIDQNDRLLLANRAALQVLGLNLETSKGVQVEKLIAQKALIDILKARQSDGLTGEVTMPNGLIYLATASPVSVDNHPVGRVCVLRDVTYFKQLDKMKTEFVNTVSHDLRSPLTLMRGYTTMLELVGPLNEQQVNYINKISLGIQSMVRLINTLLDLGRVEAGVGLQLEILPLVEVFEQVTNNLQQSARQKGVQFSVVLPKSARPFIEADQVLLNQIFNNLVENAIKYTPKGGIVETWLKINGDNMLLEVRDSGIGIDPVDQARVFEKFFRSKRRDAQEQKGTGLGLAIVKLFVERHNGKVWFESRLGKGTVFFVQLPLHQPKNK